ncbi:SRPBCC family protein [Actinomadura rudentiformis]|uniref:SRPBCC family protein n=1 Tax=Actinomadura rudentiformis TaxID=359158 RepID=A0A6H9Y840_9ACTN|nr:hypothetical protein [Actinomadura rudentiformis]KAB2340168.1 hypothetical protein F8566_45725 [Actinomadura rudentiformis]
MSYRVHDERQRVLRVPPERVWDLLSRMGTDNDPVYPSLWGWVRFPEGLYEEAPMIHDTGAALVNCKVTVVTPNRELRFGMEHDPDDGHGFVLEPVREGTRIHHVLDGSFPSVMRVAWPLVGKVIHGETIEGIFDNLERGLTGEIASPRRRPRRARLLRGVGRKAARRRPPGTGRPPAAGRPPGTGRPPAAGRRAGDRE